jgi:ABC-type multidrug transport system permease subunit
MGHPNVKMPSPRSRHDLPIYFLAVVLGGAAGYAQIAIRDLLVTALLVLASTMLLGVLRPHRPWRWTILISLLVPTIQALALWFLADKPTPAEIYESLLSFLPGIVGAYGGAVLRHAVQGLWETK